MASKFTKQSSLRTLRGFTMVELITVMVIAGVLASFALPYFTDRAKFNSRGFHDQVISTLRYAQKAAIAQNRFICVAFTANSIAVNYGNDNTCASGVLASPSGTPYPIENSNISVASTQNPLWFDALGKPQASAVITVQNTAPITIELETGYVH